MSVNERKRITKLLAAIDHPGHEKGEGRHDPVCQGPGLQRRRKPHGPPRVQPPMRRRARWRRVLLVIVAAAAKTPATR